MHPCTPALLHPCTPAQATSSVLKNAEVSEAIKKRQARFGVITADEPKVPTHIQPSNYTLFDFLNLY